MFAIVYPSPQQVISKYQIIIEITFIVSQDCSTQHFKNVWPLRRCPKKNDISHFVDKHASIHIIALLVSRVKLILFLISKYILRTCRLSPFNVQSSNKLLKDLLSELRYYFDHFPGSNKISEIWGQVSSNERQTVPYNNTNLCAACNYNSMETCFIILKRNQPARSELSLPFLIDLSLPWSQMSNQTLYDLSFCLGTLYSFHISHLGTEMCSLRGRMF